MKDTMSVSRLQTGNENFDSVPGCRRGDLKYLSLSLSVSLSLFLSWPEFQGV